MSIRPMSEETYQRFIQVSLRKQPASAWLKGVSFLNVYTGQIQQAHIHLSDNRIAYVGKEEPLPHPDTPVIELEPHQIIVPGYIEPHAHPYHLYNPFSWGEYASQKGTTISMNDNIFLLSPMTENRATAFIEELDRRGNHLWLWWARFDDQTRDRGEDARHRQREYVREQAFRHWLEHPLVIQGGEFTAWPFLLKGDPHLAHALKTIRQEHGKRVEGHLPGASVETLNALTAAGIGADHESLTGEDVLQRMRLGLYVTLRHSSIRPDLPRLLEDLQGHPELNVDRLMLTGDGAAPFFMEEAHPATLIKQVIKSGFEAPEAYRMATLNPATYYGIDQDVGGIAPGRLAHLNIIEELAQPYPTAVMFEGKWIVQGGQSVLSPTHDTDHDWLANYFGTSTPYIPTVHMLRQEGGKVGLELLNEVITRPYDYDPAQPLAENECYLTLVSGTGEWICNTRVKGYANAQLAGLASTYTASQDVLLIGRHREQMLRALEKTSQTGGGIAAITTEGEWWSMPLPLAGAMNPGPMSEISDKSRFFVEFMQRVGHSFNDPTYTLLFFTATHLPFVRLTPDGVYNIKEQRVLTPVLRLR